MYRIISDDEFNRRGSGRRGRGGRGRSSSFGDDPLAHLERAEKQIKDLRERIIKEAKESKKGKFPELSRGTIFWFMTALSPLIGLGVGYFYLISFSALLHQVQNIPIK